MNAKSFFLALVLISLLAGCMPVDSLNPLYTPDDVVFDKALEGHWVSVDPNQPDNGYMKIEAVGHYPSGLTGYTITMAGPDGDHDVFDAYLLKLDDQEFLDVVPRNSGGAAEHTYTLNLNRAKKGWNVEPHLLKLGVASYLELSGDTRAESGQLIAHLRPAHWFYKVTIDGQTLRLDWMDDDVLTKAISEGQVEIGNALLDNEEFKSKDLVVTAETKELQKFVREHVDDERVFSEHIEMTRQAPCTSCPGADAI